MTPEEYRRQKRLLEDRIQALVVPEVDAVEEAGKLLESLLHLWEEADLTERRKILVTMLDAVYVDTVEEKAVVALRTHLSWRWAARGRRDGCAGATC